MSFYKCSTAWDTHCQNEKKVSLGEIVGNLLLILPKHIYVSNLVCFAIVYWYLSLSIYFSAKELHWNLVSSW